MRRLALLAALLPLLAGGCVAKTAFDVVTFPVKAGAKAVDLTTTSQSEADRNRGRADRKREERAAKERRKAEKHCRQHPEDCSGPEPRY
ncbi:MAG: hypothetical protein JWM65_2662 [Sphingomonas bacterium]|nr:hypothetical protein [Sphingomonas bacterium]